MQVICFHIDETDKANNGNEYFEIDRKLIRIYGFRPAVIDEKDCRYFLSTGNSRRQLLIPFWKNSYNRTFLRTKWVRGKQFKQCDQNK